MSASLVLVGGTAALVVGGVLAACSVLEAENKRKARDLEAAADRAEKAVRMAQKSLMQYENCCAKEEIVDQLEGIVDEGMEKCDQLELLCNSGEETLSSIQEQIKQAAGCLEQAKNELVKTAQGSKKYTDIERIIGEYESFISSQKMIQEEQRKQLDQYQETLNSARIVLNDVFRQYMDAMVDWMGDCKDYMEASYAQYEQLMGKS